MVIGADQEGNGQVGAAYIFERPLAGWGSACTVMNEVAELVASDASSGDRFGHSVAISGDTVVVGTWNGADRAYVFVEPVAGWGTGCSDPALTQTAILTASDDDAGLDYFGGRVAIYGETIVVGRPDRGHGLAGQGAVYVFSKPPAGWVDTTETAELTACDAAVGDGLGICVAMSPSAIITGAPPAGQAGVAYVFAEPAGGWMTTDVFEARIAPASGQAGDWFGTDVALAGGVALVGAVDEDAAGIDSGAAHSFEVGNRYYCNPASGSGNNTATISITACDLSSGTEVRLSAAPQGQFCYLLIGNSDGIVHQPPGAKGYLCLVGGSCLGRYAKDLGQIDASGSFSTDVSSSASGGPAFGIPTCGGNIHPGETWFFQYWHRQPMGQPSTFSEAIGVTFQGCR